MKKFKKLLALGLSIGVLLSSIICANAVGPNLDDLIKRAYLRADCTICSYMGPEYENVQLGQVAEARRVCDELCQLKNSGVDVSDDVLQEYVHRLEAIGVEFF